MNILHQQPLKNFNTLAVNVRASSFCSVDSVEQLRQLVAEGVPQSTLVLGGGSNLVFTCDYDGLVIHNNIKGLEVVKETATGVQIRVGGGVVWDELVATCIERGWYGLENLSWIPGSVGAAPVQNIGAYGVELKLVLESVEVLSLAEGVFHRLSNEECQFGYRDSVFKREENRDLFITHVLFNLSKQPKLELEYGDVSRCAQQWGYQLDLLTPADVRAIIIRIRSLKLPDPARHPNVGSFFKNPVVSQQKYNQLLQKDPAIVAYPLADGSVKLAAGWLIDRLQWKGKRVGQAHVHDQQALVLINDGDSGKDVLRLARAIQKDVLDRWEIDLEIEPSVI